MRGNSRQTAVHLLGRWHLGADSPVDIEGSTFCRCKLQVGDLEITKGK
jgi:hypothetical protein